MNFTKKQKDCSFDFFFHCWKLGQHETYKASPWRTIDPATLVYNDHIPTHLQELYNPVSCEFEEQSYVTFDLSKYTDTLAFRNTMGVKRSNIQNILYQMYSRNKAKNLVNNAGRSYDFVIMVRFDISVMPDVILPELDTTMIYVSNLHRPRNIIPDNCIISPMTVFLKWFNIYEDLQHIVDNSRLSKTMTRMGETLEFNAEELILAQYVFHYGDMGRNIRYFQGGLI